MNCKVIVLDGPDAVGKYTQAHRLVNNLKRWGKKAVYVEVPLYDSWSGKIIEKMLTSGAAFRRKNVFEVLQFINKFAFQQTKLQEYLRQYDYVVLDRWSLSMLAYGTAAGVNSKLLNILYCFMFIPDFTIILDGNLKSKSSLDCYERNDKFQNCVRGYYREWASENMDRSKLLRVDGLTSELASKHVWTAIINSRLLSSLEFNIDD
jgi:dTMP kinase